MTAGRGSGGSVFTRLRRRDKPMPTLECPICRRTVSYTSIEEVPFRPFCSERCKLVDLGRWLTEEYRISEEVPPEQIEGGSPPEAPDESEP